MSSPQLLLDTCAIIFSALGTKMSANAVDTFRQSLIEDAVYVSPVSAWEIGRAMSLGRIASPLPPIEFYRRFAGQGGISERALSAEILVAASFLPGDPPKDPMDRAIIASAREHQLTILTRDDAILAYGQAGHVRVLAC